MANQRILPFKPSDHWADNLPDEFYRIAYYPIGQLLTNDSSYTVDKIGGNKPFLNIDEEWPTVKSNMLGGHYQFAFQLTLPDTEKAREENLPGRGKTVRVFFALNMDEPPVYLKIDYIDYCMPHRTDVVPPTFPEEYPAYEIIGWQENRELDPTRISVELKKIDDQGLTRYFVDKYLPKIAYTRPPCDYTYDEILKDGVYKVYSNFPEILDSDNGNLTCSKAIIKYGGVCPLGGWYLERNQRLHFETDPMLPWILRDEDGDDVGMRIHVQINPETTSWHREYSYLEE